MAVSSRQNQNMMNLIRKVHGLVERPDLTNTGSPRTESARSSVRKRELPMKRQR